MRQPHSSVVIWIQLVIWYALGMRQVCEDFFPEIETVSRVYAGDETPMNFPNRLSEKNKYALGMRRPHSSLVIWIQLEHDQDLDGINVEQGYASGVCAGQATL